MWEIENAQRQGHRLIINIVNATEDEKEKEEEPNEQIQILLKVRNNRKDILKEIKKKNKEITSKTLKKYPITNQKCKICGTKATQHHHTTEIYEIDKFIFLCHDCHLKVHGKNLK